MMICLNLCEIFTDDWIEKKYFKKILKKFSKRRKCIRRIYIGSSFCSQYYLKFSGYKELLNICKEENISVTLVLPIFSEKDIVSGKQKTIEMIANSSGKIDEVTVNDIGMLWWFREKNDIKINLGRLFFKDPRDCRVPKYYHSRVEPVFLTNISDDYWKHFNILGVELDPTNQIVDTSIINDSNINIGIHVPFCYMTTGNICKFASIHKEIKQKFRPNLSCGMECMHISDIYMGGITQTSDDLFLYRYGRTLYFKVNSIEFVGKKPTRIIYFPVDEWRNIRIENTSSIK